jgi:hypothetical protein
MNTTLDQITPEVIQAVTAQATARGLSVNDYLKQLLGINGKAANDLALSDTHTPPRNEEMLAIIQRSSTRLKDMPVYAAQQKKRLK